MDWKVSCLGEGGVEGDQSTTGVVNIVVVLEGDWPHSTHSVTHRLDPTHSVTHRLDCTHSVSSQSTGRPSLERRVLAKNLEARKVS